MKYTDLNAIFYLILAGQYCIVSISQNKQCTLSLIPTSEKRYQKEVLNFN